MLPAGTRVGPYEIVSWLGAGSMGEVYRARDTKLHREVALKTLPDELARQPERLARLKQEARILASLNHPGIATLHGLEESDSGVPVLVMELVEGEALSDRLRRGPLPPRESVAIAHQIALALEAAHEKGVLHRDLKPGNIRLAIDGRAKLLDFGLAKAVREAALDSQFATKTSPPGGAEVIGTAPYMSPEQARGQEADRRGDIWAFGCMLYEMLAGKRAFEGATFSDTVAAVLDREPDWQALPAETPPAVRRLLRRCLQKEKDRRLRDIGDARLELEELLAGPARANGERDEAFALEALSVVSGMRPSSGKGAVVKGTRAFVAIAVLLACVVAAVLADRALRRLPLAQPPTYRRLTFDRGTVPRARFAPDGNTVVYNALWRGEPSEVFTMRLDSRESRPLGLPGVLHAISSTSELAVGLGALGPQHYESTLARVPLAGGAPREVLEGVRSADWSPDGADLAVVRVQEGTHRVEFPIGKVLYEAKGDITDLRVSPRGDWLAFLQHSPDSPAGSLVAVDRAGAQRILSSDWADLYGLAWRPDGREVWFTAAGRGEFKALHAVTLDGRERLVARMLGQIDLKDLARDGRVLLSHPNFRIEMVSLAPGVSKERDLTWLGVSWLADLSDDGRQVLFTELPEGAGEGGLTYLRKTDGSPAVRLGEGVALGLSPDGKWALSVLTSPSRLVLLPTGVGQGKTLTRPGLTYLGEGSWFPDSRRVLFTAAANGGPSHAYVQDVEGGEPRSFGPPAIGRPLVAPDSRTVVALALDGKPILFSVDAGEARPCPGLESGDLPIRWTADGRALFFQRDRGLTAEVHRLELVTGRKKLLWELAAHDLAGADRPFVRLTPDGKSYAYSFGRDLSDLYLVDGLK